MWHALGVLQSPGRPKQVGQLLCQCFQQCFQALAWFCAACSLVSPCSLLTDTKTLCRACRSFDQAAAGICRQQQRSQAAVCWPLQGCSNDLPLSQATSCCTGTREHWPWGAVQCVLRGRRPQCEGTEGGEW